MPLSIFRSTISLIKLKLNILKNTLFQWENLGKALLTIASLLIISYIVAVTSKDLIPSLQTMLFGEEAIQWLLSIVILYFTFITFTADMITGHSLNTGQVSTDFGYLVTLPISPISIVFLKIVERLLTDYIGFIFIFSSFLGIISRTSFTWSGLIFAIILYFQISFLIGLTINLTILFLKRFFRTSTVNNFFSILGYLSAFLTLIPYLLISNKPIEFAKWLLFHLSDITSSVGFLLKPLFWLSESLLNAHFNSDFAMFSLVWLFAIVAGIAIFALLLKLNWHTHSHSASKKAIKTRKRLFSGIFQKEILLIKSDYNILINAIIMPISIIVLEVYFLRKVINFTIFNYSLNLLFGAVIYFCMFGPVNAIGAEGKSINYLETLPISPARLLNQKVIFWLVIAETLFVPVSIIAMKALNFSWYLTCKATVNIALFVFACVFVSVSISAIFARFDTKILQQRSTFIGKLSAFVLMLFAIPIKDFSYTSLTFLIIFITLATTIRLFAEGDLINRLDMLRYQTKNIFLKAFFLAIAFFATHFAITYLLSIAISKEELKLIPWLITTLIFIPVIFIFTGVYLPKQEAQFYKRLSIAKPKLIHLGTVVVIALIFISIAIHFSFTPNSKILFELSDLIHFITSFGINNTTSAILLIIIVGITSISTETLLHGLTCQSTFIKKNSNYSFALIPLMSTLFFPISIILPVSIYALLSNAIYIKWHNLSLNYIFALLVSLTTSALIILH